MSYYPRPIQPYDPIVQDQQPKPPTRYIRDNFQGTGQDSHTLPPAQDPAMWQALTNVQPITKGVIERRWGFTSFATGISSAVTRLTSFQRDSDGLRTLIAEGPNNIQSFNEDGTPYSTLFAPSGSAVRSLTSRNFQYFLDGNALDLKKWDGDASGATTKWGIDVNDVMSNQSGGGTSTTTFGPNGSTTVVDLADRGRAWTNSNNIKTNNSSSATRVLASNSSPSISSNTLEGTVLGLSVPGGTIVGITVTVKLSVTGTFRNVSLPVNLVKNGGNYGTGRYLNLTTPTSGLQTFTLGGATDLWGGTWSLADINSSNFGFKIFATGSPEITRGEFNDAGPPFHTLTTYALNTTISIDWIAITIYTSAGGGSSTSSGSSVGITSIVGGGLVTLTIGRTYYLVYFNANTGHFSDLSPPSLSTGPTSTAQINLLLATSNDPQVTHKYILATLDGNDPTILYQVAELINGGGSDVTTYIDNTPDTALALNQVLLFTDQTGTEFGVTFNDPPPSGALCIKHQGRLWMAGVPGSTHSVFFSKAIGDLTLPNGFIAGKYEEAWPGDNYFDISDGAESVSGLLSDGTSLYIGSQNHVRRLIGDDPFNFQLPQIVHPHAGVLNQEVWQLVYTQGSPAGAIWLTPDFRVIQSDFNTYLDIGSPVQDILNGIQATANTLAHASFVADGEYDLYILAIPSTQTDYCDVHLVYDMRHQKWFVWQPTNGSLSIHNNITAGGQPQWLFISGDGNSINQYSASATDDNGTAFTLSALTSWLSLGEPSQRKVLNEIEYDGDPGMTLSINGALQQADFTTPLPLVSNMASVRGPLGTQKFFVAAKAIKSRYHQFLFQSSTTVPTVLGSYNIETIPFTDL